MSIALMTRVWESEMPTHAHKLVLLAFADYADEEGRCWPSVGRVATRSQISRRQVQRVVSDLKKSGLLEVVEKERQHRTPTYQIRGDKLTPLSDSGVTSATFRGDISDTRGDKSDARGDVGVTQTTSKNHHVEPPEESLDDPPLSLKEISLRKNYAQSQKRLAR